MNEIKDRIYELNTWTGSESCHTFLTKIRYVIFCKTISNENKMSKILITYSVVSCIENWCCQCYHQMNTLKLIKLVQSIYNEWYYELYNSFNMWIKDD